MSTFPPTSKLGTLCAVLVLSATSVASGQPTTGGAQPGPAPAAGGATPGPVATGQAAPRGPRYQCYGSGAQRYCYAYYREGYCVFYGNQRSCKRYSTAPAQPSSPGGRPPSGATPLPTQPSGPAGAVGGATPVAPAPIAGAVGGETEAEGARTLKGYTFAYPRYLGNAFIAASFHAGAGVEFYDQEGVESEVETPDGELEVFEFDRELVFARLRTNLDFAIGESFGFGAGAEYRAQVGANEQSLFLYGAETGYAITPRIKVRLWRGAQSGSQLSLEAHGAFSGGLRAVPQGLLRELAVEIAEIAQDDERITCLVAADFECAFDEADLVDAIQLHRQSYGGGGMLAFAQRLGGAAGLQLDVGLDGVGSTYSWGYIGDVNAGSVLFHAGASPSLNFYPSVPLGLAFEYRFQVEHTSYESSEEAGIGDDATETATGHRIGIGAYFTGRRDLQLGTILGLSFMSESAEIGRAASDGPEAFIAALQFDMRYFF
ncbi:MAG: hypothetical protein JRI68_06940 [Deltaproteobacteria bacterium]|nr:hypothetical protein [Deltaproteobacteria bacterium]